MKPHIAQSLREIAAAQARHREHETSLQLARLVPLGDSLADEMILFRLRVLGRRADKRNAQLGRMRAGAR
jgi:hypothetical protein